MRRPQGYVYVSNVDDGKVLERDSITCCHCNRVVLVKPGTGGTVYWYPQLSGPPKEEAGARCACCDAPVCLTCHADGRCLPLMKRIEAMEGRRVMWTMVGMSG